jgi:hypothetical protein
MKAFMEGRHFGRSRSEEHMRKGWRSALRLRLAAMEGLKSKRQTGW